MMEGERRKCTSMEFSASEAVPSFLQKTFDILEVPWPTQDPRNADIITWTRNGEGFIVKKVKEFSEQILPIYFRHNNYTSFVRQLNMYDFHKTRQENQENAFKNNLFRKGCRHLLKEIQRKDYKKNREHPRDHERYSDHRLSEFVRLNSTSDANRCSFERLSYNIVQLDAKLLSLAELRAYPSKDSEVLALIDLLFQLGSLHGSVCDRFGDLVNQMVLQEASRAFRDATVNKPLESPSTAAVPTQPLLVSERSFQSEASGEVHKRLPTTEISLPTENKLYRSEVFLDSHDILPTVAG